MGPHRLRSGPARLMVWAVGGLLLLAAADASAVEPSLNVWASHGWKYSTFGDTIDVTTPRYGERILAQAASLLNAPTALDTHTVLPGGLADVSLDGPAYIRWDDGTDTLRLNSAGEIPADVQWFTDVDLVASAVPGVPGIGVARTIPNTILTADVQTQSVSVVLDVPAGSLTADDEVEIRVYEWSDDLDIAVTPQTVPSGFTGGGGYYTADDPASLAGQYTFDFDVQVSRYGAMRQGSAGDLFYKPGVLVWNYQNAAVTTTATSMDIDYGAGIGLEFDTPGSTGMSAWGLKDHTSVDLGAISAPAGSPADPNSVWLGILQRESIDGQDVYEFSCDVEGENFAGGTVTTPLSQTYELDYDDYEMDLYVITSNPGDLSPFPAGTYTVELWGGDGVTQTYAITLAGDIPAEQPVFTHTPGASTGWRPTIQWSLPSDPNINACVFEIEQYDADNGGFEDEVWLDPNFAGDPNDPNDPTRYTPPVDLEEGGALLDVICGRLDFAGVASDEDPNQTLTAVTYFARAASSYINVLPADINGDGVVNVTDLGILGAQWGTAGTPPFSADIAPGGGDGTVNVIDLGMLGSRWNWGPNAPQLGGPSGATSVPLPAAPLIALSSVALLLRRRPVR